MSMTKPVFWDWIDKDTPINKPLKLLPNAPKEMKIEFKKWKKYQKDYDKQWKKTVQSYKVKPNKNALKFIKNMIKYPKLFNEMLEKGVGKNNIIV